MVLTKTSTKDLKFHPRKPGKMGHVNVKLKDGIPPPIYKQNNGGNHRQKSFLSKNIWCEQVTGDWLRKKSQPAGTGWTITTLIVGKV